MDSGMEKLKNQNGISRQQAVQPVMPAFCYHKGIFKASAFGIHNVILSERETERPASRIMRKGVKLWERILRMQKESGILGRL